MKRIKKDLLENGFIVHTETQEQYDELMEVLEETTDFKWVCGLQSYPTHGNEWKKYKEKTTIDVGFDREGRLHYADLKFDESCNNPIHSFEEIWKKNKKLKDGLFDEPFSVKIKTQEQWDEFLAHVEKETDIKWSSGNKPTEINKFKRYLDKTKISYDYFSSNTLTFGTSASEGKLYEFEEVFEEEKEMKKLNTAEVLGVKEGEEFIVLDGSGNKMLFNPYVIEDGLIYDRTGYYLSSVLEGLIDGDFTIKKPSIEVGDSYFKINIDSCGFYIRELTFDNDEFDHGFMETGNFYLTREKAKKVLKQLKDVIKNEREV